MVTIKSYTDLEQSKKLAEILPLESADMCWQYQKDRWVGEPDYNVYPQFEHATDKRDIPCWSLSSLLCVLPKGIRLLKSANISSVGDVKYHCDCPKDTVHEWYDNPVDACYEMVMRLNELKML